MSKFNGKQVTLVISGDSVHIYPSSNFIFSKHFFLASLSNGYSKLCWEHLIWQNSPHIAHIVWAYIFLFFLREGFVLAHSLRKYSLRWQGRKGRIHGQNCSWKSLRLQRSGSREQEMLVLRWIFFFSFIWSGPHLCTFRISLPLSASSTNFRFFYKCIQLHPG